MKFVGQKICTFNIPFVTFYTDLVNKKKTFIQFATSLSRTNFKKVISQLLKYGKSFVLLKLISMNFLKIKLRMMCLNVNLENVEDGIKKYSFIPSMWLLLFLSHYTSREWGRCRLMQWAVIIFHANIFPKILIWHAQLLTANNKVTKLLAIFYRSDL